MNESMITYMDNQWLQIEDNTITIGLNETGLEEVDKIIAVDLEDEEDEVTAGEICGELDSRDGAINIYSPVDGVVLEINAAVVDTPELIRDDSYGDGWIMRIEADSTEEIEKLMKELKDDDGLDEEYEDEDE